MSESGPFTLPVVFIEEAALVVLVNIEAFWTLAKLRDSLISFADKLFHFLEVLLKQFE